MNQILISLFFTQMFTLFNEKTWNIFVRKEKKITEIEEQQQNKKNKEI
jgi:hypothetical protein